MPGSPGPVLIVYTTEPGSPDDERLQLLAGLLDTPGPATTTPVGCPRWIRIAGGIAAHTRQDTELVKEIIAIHDRSKAPMARLAAR
jgi:hypothetical protein